MEAVIAHTWRSRYSHPHRTKAGRMTSDQERAALEQRLEAGEWLLPGDAAKLLGLSRSTVTRYIRDGAIGHKRKPGSRYRLANPLDVRRLLEESRIEHRGVDDSPAES
jgi:excisionase family DNA binding protein